MPSKLALLLALGFIVWLFWRDIREKPNVTGALWIAVVWMFLIASKSVSQWLHIFGLPGFTATSMEEGSPLDALVFLGLIVFGISILSKRQVSLASFLENNKWLAIFVLYCFLAVLWSDSPFVSFKRWIKILGHPIMVLVIFSEPDPREALVRLMKRCAYVLLPISILWMKYFPVLGRKAYEYGGMSNVGISAGKNALGVMSSIMGLFFLWHFLQVRRAAKSTSRRDELRLTAGLLLLAGYCLGKAHSATSVISLLLAVFIMVVLAFRSVDKRVIGAYTVVAVITLAIAQLTFDIFGTVADLSGHESTLTGRGRLWEVLLQSNFNHIFGTGFESYWLGERLEKIWAMPEFWWQPNQAHNGYLELYINLGAIGLLIFIGVIVATFWKICLDLLDSFEWGRLEIGLLALILAHNWTEAGFKGLSFPFFVFFIIAVNYPKLKATMLPTSSESPLQEEEPELIYSTDRAW